MATLETARWSGVALERSAETPRQGRDPDAERRRVFPGYPDDPPKRGGGLQR